MTRAVKRTRTASVRVTCGGNVEGDFEFGAGFNGAVEIEKNSSGADVLSFGMNLVGAFKTDNGGQAHVEAPHHPPFL